MAFKVHSILSWTISCDFPLNTHQSITLNWFAELQGQHGQWCHGHSYSIASWVGTTCLAHFSCIIPTLYLHQKDISIQWYAIVSSTATLQWIMTCITLHGTPLRGNIPCLWPSRISATWPKVGQPLHANLGKMIQCLML